MYLVAAGFAGTFIAFTMASSADAELADEPATEGAPEPELGHHSAHGSIMADAAFSWLPITSLRFWTFAVAFFGIAGALLTWLADTGTITTLVLAIAVGWITGVIASWITRVVALREASSQVGDLDLQGATGVVVVGFSQGQLGKVRVEAKGRTFDVLAKTTDEAAVAPGTKVQILTMTKGQAVVAPRAAD